LKQLTVTATLFFYLHLGAQNLVPNPSFEQNTACPTYVSQIGNLVTWDVPANHTGTPDYFHTCGNANVGVSLPTNLAGTEPPATGNAYIGLILYSSLRDQWREYVQAPLDTALVAGDYYEITLKYSLADEAKYIIDEFGIYLSDTPVSVSGTDYYQSINVAPQFSIPIKHLKNGWTTVTFCYQAVGGEKYMVIGNFLDDANTIKNHIGNFNFPACYLFIDDVSLSPVLLPQLDNDTTLCEGETLLLDMSAPNTTYHWSNGSTDSALSISEAGNYWVEYSNNCGTFYDTINIDYNPLPFVELGLDTSICDNSKFKLDAFFPDADYLWQDNSSSPSFNVDKPGQYYVEVSNYCGVAYDSITVTMSTGCNATFEMPNIFTPNNDGVNDFFAPFNVEGIEKSSIVIYNRWGSEVFKSNVPHEGWNGQSQGNDCPGGVYYWIFYYTDLQGINYHSKGFLTLAR